METLLIRPNLTQTAWLLQDANRKTLGTFDTAADAEHWCRDNGYRFRTEPLAPSFAPLRGRQWRR